MNNIDFMEIGTSNFRTLIQECSEDKYGISIEPCLYYLNQLPDKKNVKKIHAAVTHNKKSEETTLFYIPEKVIIENRLQSWFRGTNTIGDYHPLHKKHKLEHLVTVETVPLKNFKEIIIENNIEKIGFIKIDTEGHDCTIMKAINEFYKDKDKHLFPKRIMFESNENATSEQVDEIIFLFKQIGYKLEQRGYDTILKI